MPMDPMVNSKSLPMHRVNRYFEWFKKFLKQVIYFFFLIFILCLTNKFQVEVTNSDINSNDFEEIIDEKTGEKTLRMKKEVAERKGFVGMDNVDFEYVVDKNTGEQIIQIKNSRGKLTNGSTSFEMIIDPITGQQSLRMKQEVEVKCKRKKNLVFILIKNFI